jgi:HK97 gp10 family phage protein
MPGSEYFRFRYDDEAEREITRSAQWRELLQGIGDGIAVDARAHAPVGHPSKGGAASIHAETLLESDGWEARISWEKRKFWMYFSEKGTVHMPARPFLEPALERARGNI